MLIWWLLEQNKVPHLAQILPQLRDHLIWRLRNHLGTFVMTNTPYMPITLVPMGIASWCTICARSFGASDEQAALYLKCHVGHIEVLETVVRLLGYPIPPAAAQFLQAWHTLSDLRRVIIARDVRLISWVIKSCHNVLPINTAAITNDQFKLVVDAIPIDGPPPDEQVRDALAHLPAWVAALDIASRRAALRMLLLYDINALVREDLDRDIPEVGWHYALREYDIPPVPICPATVRPFYFAPGDHAEWHEISARIFGDVKHQIHIHWYFIEYVGKYKRYPTKEDFLMFVFLDIVPAKKATLPWLVARFVDCVFDGYAPIMREMEAPEFNRRAARSLRLQYRRQIESDYKKAHPKQEGEPS
jgi:hypothetical protein